MKADWIRGGFYHPFIHLGYGVEFGIPAVVAEGLAQAAVHDTWLSDALREVEKLQAAEEVSSPDDIPISTLLNEIHTHPSIPIEPKWTDGNKVRALLRSSSAPDLLKLLSRFNLHPASLAHRTLEATHASALMCAGATREDRKIRFCFYLMHAVTSSLFTHVFVAQPWIDAEVKARLVRWKVWTDLALYASRRAPELRVAEITGYKAKVDPGKEGNPWLGLVERAVAYQDRSG